MQSIKWQGPVGLCVDVFCREIRPHPKIVDLVRSKACGLQNLLADMSPIWAVMFDKPLGLSLAGIMTNAFDLQSFVPGPLLSSRTEDEP